MATYQIIAGTTALIRFQLLQAGAPIDLTSATVDLLLSDKSGLTINAGSVSITDAQNGKVALTPANVNVFVAANSPYQARWKITDGTGKIYYAPTGPRDIWEITGA